MKEQKMRKLHNPETGRHWYMRIVSLLLVAVLLWIGLENTILQVQAGQEKGPIILNGDVPDVDFWHGTAKNNRPCRIPEYKYADDSKCDGCKGDRSSLQDRMWRQNCQMEQ